MPPRAAQKSDDAQMVRPIQPATGDHDGVPFVVNPNMTFSADDALVKKYPHLFCPLEARRLGPPELSAAIMPPEVG